MAGSVNSLARWPSRLKALRRTLILILTLKLNSQVSYVGILDIQRFKLWAFRPAAGLVD